MLGAELGIDDGAELGEELGADDGEELGAEEGAEVGAEEGAAEGADEGEELGAALQAGKAVGGRSASAKRVLRRGTPSRSAPCSQRAGGHM